MMCIPHVNFRVMTLTCLPVVVGVAPAVVFWKLVMAADAQATSVHATVYEMSTSVWVNGELILGCVRQLQRCL